MTCVDNSNAVYLSPQTIATNATNAIMCHLERKKEFNRYCQRSDVIARWHVAVVENTAQGQTPNQTNVQNNQSIPNENENDGRRGRLRFLLSSLTKVNPPPIWAPAVYVYVMDSGVNPRHPCFGNRVERDGFDVHNDMGHGDGPPHPSITFGGIGHGTHVAGIIACDPPYGLNLWARIVPVALFSRHGQLSTKGFLKAFN